ncbi:biotin transporter BioY [Rosettibacter firmus]|uniref:biotin transporter BioY n=1 Tax=Rosettibacter firmus TaxID=3111522 RepID=UPI00336C0B67
MNSKETVKISVNIIDKIKSREILGIISFSLLMSISAQIIIPVQPVPFTLQTMIVLLSGAFLGSRNGFISQIIYLFMGILGLPVFAGFSSGIFKLFGPTGGYLLSFPFAAFLVGYLVEKKNSNLILLMSFILGELIILLGGASYLNLFFNGNLKQTLFHGVFIFSLWDIIKIIAAFSIYKALKIKK